MITRALVFIFTPILKSVNLFQYEAINMFSSLCDLATIATMVWIIGMADSNGKKKDEKDENEEQNEEQNEVESTSIERSQQQATLTGLGTWLLPWCCIIYHCIFNR